MISTATKIKLKRSGVPGRVPTLADLQLGELGINYNDGKLYFRQENDDIGARIIEPGQGAVIGKTIFVSVEGNDNNSGLNERDSVRSIKAAAAIAQPGDSIKVYPGQYIEDNPITFRDRVSVEGMELRNVLVTPANPDKDLYLVGDGFHATNHSFVSNQDSRDGAAIISFRPLEGTSSDRYFDAARLIRDNLDFIAGETVGFLTSGYSGFGAGQRSNDGARALELNTSFISEEAFQYINSPDYKGPAYFNPDINQCRSDLRDILSSWRYDLISDGNSETTGVGLTYYAPIKFINTARITDLVYNNKTGDMLIETDIDTLSKAGDEIKLADIRLDCAPYDNDFLIQNFLYDNTSGVGTVTLPFIHDISVGDSIKLDGLKFDCPAYGAQSFAVSNFVYDEATGSSLVTVDGKHGLSVGDTIELRDLQFDCPAYGGKFANVSDLSYNNVSGRGLISFDRDTNLVAGDTIFLYDIEMSCPAYGNAISVTDFNYDNVTGQSRVFLSQPHGLQSGDLVKLENLKFSCDSYLNSKYGIRQFVYNNTTGESVITLDNEHSIQDGQTVTLDNLVFRCDSFSPDRKVITDFKYNNVTGVSSITLSVNHDLGIGDLFKLENIAFACNSYSFTDLDVVGASYEEFTGFVTLELEAPHGQEVGQNVKLDGLEFSCVNSPGITTTIFPDGTGGFEFEILDVPTQTSMIINVGPTGFAHSYEGGGTATVGITTTLFPDGTQGFEFEVTDLISATQFVTNVGVSTIAHTYAGGGNVIVGLTTTKFPDGTQGNEFVVSSTPSPDQIIINVGVSTISHVYVNGGTVDVDSFNPVSSLDYNNLDGTGLITLSENHNLVPGDSFVLEDVTFVCDSYRIGAASTIRVANFQYEKTTGISEVTTSTLHGIQVSDVIGLSQLEFTCPGGSGITTTVFPDGTRDNFYRVLSVPTPNKIVVNAGISTIDHNYVGGGEVQVGLTTNIFPDGTRPSGEFFKVLSVPAPNQVITDIGVSSITHEYTSGGKFYTGITTNIFPETYTNPNIQVTSAAYNESTGSLTITTNEPHQLNVSSDVLLQGLEFSCNSGGVGGSPGSLLFPRNQEVYEVTSVVNAFTYTCNIGASAFAHTYVQGGTSTPQNIINAVYNENSGRLQVTLDTDHNYSIGDQASVVDLLFSCLSGGENNQPGNLLFPRPNDEFVVVAATGNTLSFNVGAFPSLEHFYSNGGSISFAGQTLSINDAAYNEQNGVVLVTTATPSGAVAGDIVTMQGLVFTCNSGGLDNAAGKVIFPRLDKPTFEVVGIADRRTYIIQVGAFPSLPHTYVSGGFSSLKKRTSSKNVFRVNSVPTPTQAILNVGTSDIQHEYVSGGNLLVGITTNIFPDGTRPDGNEFEVLGAPSNSSAIINIGVSSIPHNYEFGGIAQYGKTNELSVISFNYDNLSGISTVTIRGEHNLVAGDNVKLEGLRFTCTNSPGITTDIFPDGTAASFNIYSVDRIISSNSFQVNVGSVAFDHTYVSGGSVFIGITTNIFPDGGIGYDYIVSEVPEDNAVVVNVGVSSIQHNYIRGGNLFAGRTNERDISNFEYDFNSGLAILTLKQPEDNVFTGDLIKLKNLSFDCPEGSGLTTSIFPDGTQGFLFPVTERLNPTQYQLNVGSSPFPHTYVRGTGSAFVGITTDVFPAPGDSRIFKVTDIPSPTTVTAQIGVSSIPHVYDGGGKLFVGINTDIFPGDSEVSPLGDTYTIQSITNDGEILVNVGVSSISHSYVDGGTMQYGVTDGGQLQHITGPGVKDATIAAIDFERQMSKAIINNRPWGSFVVAETSRVTGFDYDFQTGFATVTAPGIGAKRGDTIRMSDIEFRCSDEYAGLTTTFFPDNTRDEGQYFTVDTQLDGDSFETFVGFTTFTHVYNRGGNVYRYRQNIDAIDYERITGLARVTSPEHGFREGDIVELADARFTCPVFSPDYDIENFQYDNITGVSTITTRLDNTIEIGDLIKLDNIRFECPPYGNTKPISNFLYDNQTGISTVLLSEAHGLVANPRTPSLVVQADYDYTTGILTVTTADDINWDISTNGVELDNLLFTPAIPTLQENYTYKIDTLLSPTAFQLQVGVGSTSSSYVANGTATRVNRFDVKLDGIKFDCPSYGNDIDIQDFLYDNKTGNSLVTVIEPHGLTIGDNVKLADIKFQCPPYQNNFDVIDARYDNASGIITITTAKELRDIGIGSTIRLKDLQFDCTESGDEYDIVLFTYDPPTGIATVTIGGNRNNLPLNPGEGVKLSDTSYILPNATGGITTVAYPDGRDPSYNIFSARDVQAGAILPNTTDITVYFPNVRESLAIFQNEGTLTVGITTNIYPELVGSEGGFYDVVSIPSTNQLVLDVGISSITHNYIRNGQVFTGVTTNFFPGNLQNSPKGDIFEVIDVPTPNQVRVNVGPSSISHSYDGGGALFVGITTNIFPDGSQGSIFPVIGIAGTDVLQVNVGTSSIPHTYRSGGDLLVGITTDIFPGNEQNSPLGSIFKVVGKNPASPDRFVVNVGVSSITHNYLDGGTVTTGVTTDIFPDGTNGFTFPIVSVDGDDNFFIDVGASTIDHTYVSGGYTRLLETPVRDFDYDNVTGIATIRITDHRYNNGDIVKLRDIKFDCDPYGGEQDVTDLVYDNTTGRAFITVNGSHNLAINDLVKLSDIQLDCPAYGNDFNINGALYDSSTGDLLVSTVVPHGLEIGEDVKIEGLEFNCPGGSGITTTIFPDGAAPSLNIFKVTGVPDPNGTTFVVRVGVSSIQHTYVAGGRAFVGITTNIFPGNLQNSPKGSILRVTDTPSSNSFAVEVGLSSIAHNYVRGGLVQTGVTTDLFPDGSQGDYFVVSDVINTNLIEINAGISSIKHRYNSGGFASKYATYQSKEAQVIDTSVIRVSGDCAAVGARVDQLAGIVTSILTEGPEYAPGGAPLNIVAASYNNATGDISITTDEATGLEVNNLVKIENLIFSCQKTSAVHGATYDNETGVCIITSSTPHGLEDGGEVLLEGLEFACPGGSLLYPENPASAISVSKVYDKYNFELNLNPSSKVHTYVKGGTITSVPTTRVFPDMKRFIYPVAQTLSERTFIINVGTSNLPHTYVSGGLAYPGLRNDVRNATYNRLTGIVTVETEQDHYLVENTGVNLSGLLFSCASGGEDNAPGTLPFPDNRPANVLASTYDNVTGLLTIRTEKPHQLYRDAFVKLEGLTFGCPGGSLVYPSNPEKLLRVTKVQDDYNYEIQLTPSTKVHTYLSGGTSNPGPGNYRVNTVESARVFTLRMASNNLEHTYVSGGSVASLFTEQELDGLNLRTDKCADDVKKLYLAVAHDITRGGNWKCVEGARKYFDQVGQFQFIAGGEVNQTVEALEYSLNVVRCVINNVSWGGVPRGYFTETQKSLLSIPESTQTSVVRYKRPIEAGQGTWDKKEVIDFQYDKFSGVAEVRTSIAHELSKYNAIQLSDLEFRCANSPRVTTNIFPDGTQGEIFEVLDVIQDNEPFTVSDAIYDNETGIMRVISQGNDFGIPVGSLINLRNLRFVCNSTGSNASLTYPENPENIYEVISRPNASELKVNVGVSTIVHTYNPIFNPIVGNEPTVQQLPTKFRTHVGTVDFDHTWFEGGSVWRRSPFTKPVDATQVRDVSIQFDPLQNTNSTPNACANVFSAIENCVGIVTTIVKVGFEGSGISTSYPGNNGKGVPTFEQMASQGVGNIIKGPYIRNCTNFVPKSIGMRMDGFDAEPGDEISNGVQGSSNVDSFTQFNPGGIGCSVSNGTYQQLVSIFTICCDQAIVADSGAQLDLTNSNSSFGRLGLVARGIGDAKSKCIDRYTGVVAKEAEIEDDVVIIAGVGNKRPYDGQGIFFGELYREVISIRIDDSGSGYDDLNPPFASIALPTGPSGIKAEVSPTVQDGKVVSIEVISNGNQYREKNPIVTIDPPDDSDGRQAKATAITEPLYYDVDSSGEPNEGTVRVVFKQRLNNTVSIGTTVFFSRLSLQIASSHSFEYIGAGNEIDGARPSQGGVPIKANEVIKEDGGSIVYTSTDQAGNFNIGDDFVINQFTGTVTGRSFDQSVLNKVTPLIIALDS
jgi:hypothetical protein